MQKNELELQEIIQDYDKLTTPTRAFITFEE